MQVDSKTSLKLNQANTGQNLDISGLRGSADLRRYHTPEGVGDPRSYGFIYITDNSSIIPYGFESLYYNKLGALNYNRIQSIRDLKRRESRLYAYNIGLLTDKDIYQWFSDLIYRQNNRGYKIINACTREVIESFQGRFCNRKGKRSAHIQKIFQDSIGEISDCILLTLSTHQTEVMSFMDPLTNLKPVEFAICNIGRWTSKFLSSLRHYQERNSIPWEFVGWTLQFQENGFPHIHMIFRGRWLGSIQSIARLWPYCEPQGVDYEDKKKYEERLMSEGKLSPGKHVSGIHLVKYITAYVSKCEKAYIADKGVHKGYAWLAFSKGRLFSVSRKYKSVNEQESFSNEQTWFPYLNKNRLTGYDAVSYLEVDKN